MSYVKVTERLETAYQICTSHDEHKRDYQTKLHEYLFLCLAYELSQHRDSIQLEDPKWSDPETTFSIVMYRTSYKGFGYKRDIHIWITSEDYENANLMILLAYILLGHPEWSKGVIKIHALYPKKTIEDQRSKLLQLIRTGRLPISPENTDLIPQEETQDYKAIITEKSIDADLTIIGFRDKDISKGISLFTGFGDVGNILFINSDRQKEIK